MRGAMTRFVPGIAAVVILCSAALVGGCATAASGGTGQRDLITAEEIARSGAPELGELIRALRPAWLHTRGPVTSLSGEEGVADVPIVVYVDNVEHGSLSDMEGMPTQGITEVRRLSPASATQRFGTGHARGAILISTDPGRLQRR